jgi:hypothetical protein
MLNRCPPLVIIIDMSIQTVLILHGAATSRTNKWATSLTMQVSNMLLQAVQVVEFLMAYCTTQQCIFATNCNKKTIL